jgi:hypothetical protein
MDLKSKLQKIKDQKSYSIPAKRLKEHLKPILSRSEELEKRWIWELIQNATDLGDKISIKIEISNDQLRFSHNGKPFTLNEAYNLIMPDSGKDEEHEINKNVVGQFGTGFISTHILSKKIKVEGIAHEEEADDYYDFEFILDRTERTNKEELIDSITSSENQFSNNLKKSGILRQFQKYNTSFTYYLNDHYDGLESKSVISRGLDYFEALIPYVFCFRPELTSLEIHDNRENGELWTYDIKKLNTQIKDLKLLSLTAKTDNTEEWSTIIGTISEGKTDIAFEVKHLEEEIYEVQPYPENCPKLFCAFPMIGTEDFNFPVIINSLEFVPNRERDGIELTKYDKENRRIIEEAMIAYGKLIEVAAKHSWTKTYNLCSISNNDYNYIWFRTKIRDTIKTLVTAQKIIDSEDRNNKKIRVAFNDKTFIPYIDGRLTNQELLLNSVFDLISFFIPENIPLAEDHIPWYNTLDFDLFTNQKMTLEQFLKVIDHHDDLTSIKSITDITLKSREKIIIWMNKLVSFLFKTNEIELLNKYAIIPSQAGTLENLSNLKINNINHKFLNVGFGEKLKDVYSIISGKDIREELIHKDIKDKELLINKDKKVSLKDFSLLVDNEFREYSGDRQDSNFLSSLKAMFDWYTTCGLSKETLADYFPWFSRNKAQLYMDTQTSAQRSHTFDILLSGKAEALAKIAKSDLTIEDLNNLVNNSNSVNSFFNWLNEEIQDNPNEELGNIGEEFVYHILCKLFGKNYVEWIDENAYDFKVMNQDNTVRYYVDAKTTSRGIGNSDNIPFYMRYSQWDFLPKEQVIGKYLIARVFKKAGSYEVRFLNVKPENLK